MIRQVIIWHPLGIFDIAIKSKLWKSTNETEQELIRQISIWHHLGICNIVKKLKWWNNNIFATCLYTWWLLNFSFLCFLCVFLLDYRQKPCDIWRNWAGIVSISLVFDTSSEFLMLLKNKNCEKALSKLSRNCLDSLAFDTSSAFIIFLKN